MKIIIIGASGTLGSAVVKAFNGRHEIIKVGYSRGDYLLDIADEMQIEKLFEAIGSFDALIATIGKVHFGALQEMDVDKWMLGINNKLMGQVNLVTHGLKHISPSGSFTLTSGLLNHDPIVAGTSAAMINGALDGFVTSAAIEMPEQVRINIVSPALLEDSVDKYRDFFPGFPAVPAKTVAQAYVKSVEGRQTGQVYRVGW